MATDLRTLLIEVAEGRLDPSAAARLLDEPIGADSSAPTASASAGASVPTAESAPSADNVATEPVPPNAAPPVAAPPVAARRMVLQASARPARVIADTGVATVSVDGPHRVRHEGDALVIDAGPAPERGAGGYTFERKGGFSRWLEKASSLGAPITVRVNPEFAVHVELTAGSLDVVGLRGPLSFSIAASTVKVRDCTGVLTGIVRAGSAKLELRPVVGAHSLRVETGSADLVLQPGSDVRVRARVDVGEVKVDGVDAFGHQRGGGAARDVVVGAGAATFDLDVVMGSVKVRTP